LFVAIDGNGGTIIASSDGFTWKKQTSEITTGLFDIIYENGMFVTVGVSGIILTSLDGFTWTKQITGTTNALNNIIYIKNMFVATGASGAILTCDFTMKISLE
jgi:hypothetical protein